MYGNTGYSPRVTLYAFKEGKQFQVATRRKIGNYANLSLDCTPTGEAMAAVADLLDDVAHKRRILMVMTDGIADNPKLCEDVITVLERSEEHTSELESLMRISYAVFCLKKTKITQHRHHTNIQNH